MTEIPGTLINNPRIEAAVERIHAAVAELSEPEQHEAQARALVSSVPEKLPYTEQLKSFTSMTHVMRTLMARQLEQPFRDYLRDESPRLDPELKEKKDEQNTKLVDEKDHFSRKTADDLSRLGLSLEWKGIGPCYLGAVDKSERHTKGRYSIRKYGESGHVDCVTDWRTARDQPERTVADRLNYVSLMDAAAPGEHNALRPSRKR